MTTDHTPPPASGSSAASSRRTAVLATVAGLVAGLAIGVLAGRATAPDDGSDPTAVPDTRPIEMPAELAVDMPDDATTAAAPDTETAADETVTEESTADEPIHLRLATDVAADIGDEQQLDEFRRREDSTTTRGESQLQDAYGGAATAVATYADDEFSVQATAIVVRAPSPGLYSTAAFADPAELGLKVGTQEVIRDGDVSCIVSYVTVAASSDEAPEAQGATCQRSDTGLTAVLQVPGSEATPEQVMAWTDALFEAVRGADGDSG